MIYIRRLMDSIITVKDGKLRDDDDNIPESAQILPTSSQNQSNGMSSINNQRIKILVLILLCCQNAGHALLARYSQSVLKENYSSTEVVIFAEIVKLVFSGYVTVTDHSESDAPGSGLTKLVWLLLHSQKIVILVILYAASNILSYYALARVDAAAYTVVLQLKIFTTAIFGVFMLGKSYSSAKWRALLLLVLGAILVASPTYNRKQDCAQIFQTSEKNIAKTTRFLEEVAVTPEHGFEYTTVTEEDHQVSLLESMLGIGAVVVMVIMSGYSSIYFEGMLKQQSAKITIWERNFQLAFYSIAFLIMLAVWENSSILLESVTDTSGSQKQYKSLFIYVPFQGWSFVTLVMALLQAGGGLLVAATLKYADAVLKTLATCGSIVLSALLGYFLLGGTLDIFVGIGSIATILAISNYSLDP